jgi:hypothetical protein
MCYIERATSGVVKNHFIVYPLVQEQAYVSVMFGKQNISQSGKNVKHRMLGIFS